MSTTVFRARYFQRAIEEEDMEAAIRKLKNILELDEHENDFDDLPSDDEEDDEPNAEENEYVVDKVLAEKVDKGQLKFLTKWVGFEDEKDQTWEPLENFPTKGSKMAIFLFYKEKWIAENEKHGGAVISSSVAVYGKNEKCDKERKHNVMRNGENVTPPNVSNPNLVNGKEKNLKYISGEKEKSHSSASVSSKQIEKPVKQFSGFEEAQPSKLSSTMPSSSKFYPKFESNRRVAKNIRPLTTSQIAAKQIKDLYTDGGIYFQKDELQKRREMQQQQAKEYMEKKRQAESIRKS